MANDHSNSTSVKNCTGCNQEKPLTDFNRHPSGKYGLSNRCKTCTAEYKREYRKKNREKLLEKKRQYRAAIPKKPKQALQERLERKYIRRGDSECWPWIASKNNKGYGLIYLGEGPNGPLMGLAHRASYSIYVGPIPEGLYALHRCDNPSCVNPAHLFLGTIADNSRDMIDKGRGRYAPKRGEKNPRAKLTNLQAAEIRRRRAGGEKGRAIARELGVDETVVSRICKLKTYRE